MLSLESSDVHARVLDWVISPDNLSVNSVGASTVLSAAPAEGRYPSSWTVAFEGRDQLFENQSDLALPDP